MKDSSNDPHIWMIRTSENVLSGPYTREQLVQLVEEEKLELTDEICRGNSYWIYLHEEQEVKKHLGIEVPAALVEPEEPTQTETDSLIARRNEPSQVAAMGARAQRSSTVSPEPGLSVARQDESLDDVPELSVAADSIEDHTAVLNNRAFREFRPREQASQASAAAVPEASPQSVVSQPEVEGVTVNHGETESLTRFWIYTAIVLVVGAVAIYFAWKRLHG